MGEYLLDILVEGQVIIELKAADQLQKIHEAQLLNYLEATNCKIGLLVNSRIRKLKSRDLVFDTMVNNMNKLHLATDTHRLTQTFNRKTCSAKMSHRFTNSCLIAACRMFFCGSLPDLHF